MDKMSVFSMLTVSLPETILNMYVAFLILGIWMPEIRVMLPFKDSVCTRKSNIAKFCMAAILTTAITILTRWFLYNMIIILILNIVLAIIILKYVYKFKWYQSSLLMLIFALFIIIIESIFVPPTLKLLNASVADIYKYDHIRLILSLVDRVFQITAMVLLWKWQVIKINMDKSKYPMKWIIATISAFVLAELLLYYIVLNTILKFDMLTVVIGAILCVLLLIINILIVITVMAILKCERRDSDDENI